MHLAIVPARGGSKRIPRKNLVPFAGRPLIAHPLAAAVASGLFDEIHVSTDDAAIAEVATAEGCPPRFARPSELSDDYTGLLDVLRWVVHEYEGGGESITTVTLIYATAPLLEAADLAGGFALFREHGGSAPVLSVAEFPAPAQWAAIVAEDGRLEFLDRAATEVRSQDLPPTYYDAAAFNLYGRDHLMKMAASDLRYLPYPLPRYRVTDIDTQEDLALAERLYRAKTLD
ncbi:MAG: acylneuraminate cytidylyltransferase family protein [Kiloniellales bacterium]